MARGSADRYFQQDIKDQLKLVPGGNRGPGAIQGPGARHRPPAGRRGESGDGLYRLVDHRRAAEAGEVRPDHQCRPVAKAMSTTSRSLARRPIIRRARLDDPRRARSRRRSKSSTRSSPRRAKTGRRRTRSSRAISSTAAMPARRIGERCASSCSEPSAGRRAAGELGARRCLGLPRTSPQLLDFVRTAARAGAARRRTRPRGRRPRSRLAQARASPLVAPRRMAGACSSARRSTCASIRASDSRDDLLAQFPDAVPTPLSPWGLRLPSDSRVDDHPAFDRGLVEVQDEGSQLIALACEPQTASASSTFAPGPAARRWRSLRLRPGATILATDSNRARLSKLRTARRAGRRARSRRACSIRRNELRGARRLARRGRSRARRCALLGQRHLAAQSRRALAAHARAARPPGRGPGAAARYRRGAGRARRAAGLRGLLAPVPRRGRADRGASSAPFIVD